ncbi:MAG: DUF4416 family protein [Candidatus Zixiibacteriota bacterium]
MARVQKPPQGRLIVGVIHSSLDALADSLKALERRFGRVQCETTGAECADGDFYREEMGADLQRRFFSFERPVSRESLVEIKGICHKIEPLFADRTGEDFYFRTVNIDPGILTPSNLVVASHREQSHRVYLANGVYAETVLIFSRGQFCRLPWTSPDYYADEAIDFFLRVRGTFGELQRLDSAAIGV